MSWLDPLLAIKTQQAGTTAGTRQTINFASGATVTDDPANDRVNVAIAGGLPGVTVTGTPTAGQTVVASSASAAAWGSVPRGNVANTSGAVGDLITGDATTLTRLGIGSAGQVLTVSGGVPVWGGGTLRNYDANHVAAWPLDSTDGNTFLASVGGVNITGGSGAFATVQGGGIFPRSLNRAATYSQTTGDVGFNILNALSLSGTTSFTVEFYYYVNQSSMYSGIACHLIDIISPSGLADNFLAIKGNFPAGNFRTVFRTNSGDVEMLVGVGAGYAQTAPNTAHHVMVVWSVNSFVRLFIDGVQVGSSGASSRSATVLSTLTFYMTAGLYMADLRVSNVARDASYAQTATRLLMTM